MSGGVCLQSPPQLSGRCSSNGVIVPRHPSSKLHDEVVNTNGVVLTELLHVSSGVGGQKYTSLPSMHIIVGDEGVRSPLCFLKVEGDKAALLGIGDRTIGSVVFNCAMFN